MSSYEGLHCETKRKKKIKKLKNTYIYIASYVIYDDNLDKYNDLITRLDSLYNISPEFYLFDNDQFPRLT